MEKRRKSGGRRSVGRAGEKERRRREGTGTEPTQRLTTSSMYTQTQLSNSLYAMFGLEVPDSDTAASAKEEKEAPHLSIATSPVASTQELHSEPLRRLNEVAPWMEFAWSLWSDTLVAQSNEEDSGLGQDTHNVVLSLPQLFSLFATILQSKEADRKTDKAQTMEKQTLSPTAHIGPKIRGIVFYGSAFPAYKLQDLFNQWEAELADRLDWAYARRLLVSRGQTHSYSLSAFRLLAAQDLEVKILAREQEKEVEAESADQVLWLKESLRVKPPPNLYAAATTPAFSLSQLARKRALVVSLASALQVPILKAAIGSASPQAFCGFNGVRYLKLKSVPYVSLRRPLNAPIRGNRIVGVDGNWGIWELPTEPTAQLDVYVVSTPEIRVAKTAYDALLRAMTFKMARRWISTLRNSPPSAPCPPQVKGKTAKEQRWNVAELWLPNGSVFPEEPLSLRPVLEARGLGTLFSESTDLGDLSPQGHLGNWVGVDVLRLPKHSLPTGSMTASTASDLSGEAAPHRVASALLPVPADALVLRSTAFLLVWDRARNIPVTLARLGRPATRWGGHAPLHTPASAGSDHSLSPSALNTARTGPRPLKCPACLIL